MKRFKSLSVVVASALLVSSVPMTAFGDTGVTTGGDISGGGTIIDGYVLDVDVPTSIEFTVNPQEFDVTVGSEQVSNQIISPGYSFRNRSSMPIQLDVIPTFTNTSGVTIVTNENEILNTNNEGHKIYMEIQPATVKPDVKGDGNAQVSAPAVTTESNYTTGPAITQDNSAKLSFKLGAATYELQGNTATYKASDFANNDAVSFKFGGKVSKYSKWDGKTINVNVKYDFGTISEEDYVDATNQVAGTYNVLNKDLMGARKPSILGTPDGKIIFQNASDYFYDGKYHCSQFYFAKSTTSITPDRLPTVAEIKAKPGTDVKPGVRANVLQPSAYTYDNQTGIATLNSTGIDSLAGNYVVYYGVFVTEDGTELEVVSDQVQVVK